MSEKSNFRGLFDKQHYKRAQALLKSAWQYLYQIHWSLRSQLSWEKFLFLTSQFLGVVFNTLAADEKYIFRNGDNLTITIEMQLS